MVWVSCSPDNPMILWSVTKKIQFSLVSSSEGAGVCPRGGECCQLTRKQNCLMLNLFCSRRVGIYSNCFTLPYSNSQKPVERAHPTSTFPEQFLSISSHILLTCTHPLPFMQAKWHEHLLPCGTSQYSSENDGKGRRSSFSLLSHFNLLSSAPTNLCILNGWNEVFNLRSAGPCNAQHEKLLGTSQEQHWH